MKIFKDCKFFKYLRRYEDFQRKMKNFCSKNFPLGSNLNNFSIFQTNLSKILFNFKIFEASKILQLLKMNQRWRRRWIFGQKSSKLRCNTAMDAPTHLTPSPGLSGCPCPPRLQEETWRIGGVRFPDMESWWNFHRSFYSINSNFSKYSYYSNYSTFIRNLKKW